MCGQKTSKVANQKNILATDVGISTTRPTLLTDKLDHTQFTGSPAACVFANLASV
jgi:hypothetical protein